MGLFSRRSKAGLLAVTAIGYIRKNPDKVKNGLTKAGDFANKKTHGKYSKQITGAQTKASQAIDKASGGNGRNGTNPTLPPNR